jgi:hypothetical protein
MTSFFGDITMNKFIIAALAAVFAFSAHAADTNKAAATAPAAAGAAATEAKATATKAADAEKGATEAAKN